MFHYLNHILLNFMHFSPLNSIHSLTHSHSLSIMLRHFMLSHMFPLTPTLSTQSHSIPLIPTPSRSVPLYHHAEKVVRSFTFKEHKMASRIKMGCEGGSGVYILHIYVYIHINTSMHIVSTYISHES